MAQAKTLTHDQLTYLLDFVSKNSAMALRDYAVILLSFKGGLRVGEVASLRWRNVVDATGELSNRIEVPAHIAKSSRHRYIPMHPATKIALAALRKATVRGKLNDPIILGRDHDYVSPNTLQRYLGRLYKKAGYGGVSSHSGRRSFITAAAREANKYGCSLKDVQQIAGHSDLGTTQTYIDTSPNWEGLVGSI
jgi:integrase/recombinase XerD